MLQAALASPAQTYTRERSGLDPEAAVRTHAPLVRRLAWQIHSGMSSAIEIEDLIQIGMIALVEATRGFEERGAPFAAYAATRIRGAMIDHLRRDARMSRSGIVNRRTLAATRHRLEAELGRQARDSEMAAASRLSPDAYFAMAQSARPLAQDSLDEVYSDHHIWFADAADGADSAIERAQFTAALAQGIAALPAREAMVLQLYFVEEMNLEEIGAAMQVGAARICQIKRAALERLRGLLGDCDAD